MSPTAFATCSPLDPGELQRAPVRYPRPGRLRTPLVLEGAKAERAAAALGLLVVSDLLEHLPRDRREARAIAQLEPGETATLVAQVTGIASRPVRRRGMRPLVQATVADGTGHLVVDLLQPAVARRALSGRDPARAARQVRGLAALQRPGTRAHQRGDRGRRPRRTLPRHRGALLDADPGPRPRARGRLRRCARAAAGLAARPRASRRARRRACEPHTSPAPTRTRSVLAPGSRSRSCCSPNWRCSSAAGAAPTAHPRPCWRAPASSRSGGWRADFRSR